MKTALVAASLVAAFTLASAPAEAQSCWRATAFSPAPPGMPASYQLTLVSQACTSTPALGGQTRTAGSSSCDFDRMNVRVELRKTGCTGALGSAVKSTFFTMLGCF